MKATEHRHRGDLAFAGVVGPAPESFAQWLGEGIVRFTAQGRDLNVSPEAVTKQMAALKSRARQPLRSDRPRCEPK